MAADDFDEFVKRRKAQAEKSSPIDWEKRRQEWLDDIQALYGKIQEYLRDYIVDGRIETSYEPVIVNEERLGIYNTRKLVLKIGEDVIEFVPIGAVIFGAWGRVDIIGPRGNVRLVLVDREANNAQFKVTILNQNQPVKANVPPSRERWAWKIAGSPPGLTLTDLTSETLRDAILEVANA